MRADRISCGVLLLALAACGAPPPCEVAVGTDICAAAAALGLATGLQLADASATGSGSVGQTDMVRRDARVSLAIRTTVAPGASPRLDGSPTTPGRTSFVTDPGTAAMVSGEVAARVFDGVKGGSGRAGGIDVLGNVGLLMLQDGGGLSVRSGVPVLGVGARIGVVDETRLRPALSLAVAARAITRFSIEASSPPTADGVRTTVTMDDGSVAVIGGRIAASKRVGALGISAGGGIDSYDLSGVYLVTVEGTPDLAHGDALLTERRQRSIAFLNTSYTVGQATIGVEFGRLWGGRGYDRPVTLAGPSPTKPRTFVSIGIRFTPRLTGTP